MDAGQVVQLVGRDRRVEWRGGTAQRPLLKLDGIDDRETAAGLAGEPIEVPRAALGPLEAGEHLVDDLVGCAVTDGTRAVGLVTGVLSLPSVDCLEVERHEGEGQGQMLLVPLVGDAVRSLDVEGGRIDVNLEFVEGSGA
jgi:16S rRNA processing protein RimM